MLGAMRWTHGTVAFTAIVASALSFFAGRWSARPPFADCPELSDLEPALARLDRDALERRLRAGAILPPSGIEKQLAALRTQADAAPPARRACLYRTALARNVASQESARRTTPSLWGLERPSAELRELFLTEKLTRGWSRQERLDVLAQVDAVPISRLAGADAADLEHWRRQYYGLLVTCEVADELLPRLGAARPPDCLRHAPRRPAP
jgi:hypothetical protein